jgi:uncharacterized protein
MRCVCIYHSFCHDGFGAAWSAYKYFGKDAVYIPLTYNRPLPKDQIPPNLPVYFLDFSASKDILEELSKTNQVFVLDHHISAWNDLKDFPAIAGGVEDNYVNPVNIKFDMKKSGAVIAWEFFHGKQKIPALLEYIQDRDLWIFDNSITEIIHAYLLTEPMEYERWDIIAEQLENFEGVQNITQQGAAILRRDKREIENVCKQAFFMQIEGKKAIAINATSMMSDVAQHLLDLYPEAELAACFFITKNMFEKWSLRSRRGQTDVSVIAKRYGGGGHTNAAGFNVKLSESLLAPGGSN